MNTIQDKVKMLRKFNRAFGVVPGDYVLRYELMKEENKEYLTACALGDRKLLADSLGDMLFVLIGTIVDSGMADIIDDIFLEVYESNMSKLGEDGKPILRADGKIMKGPNFKEPDIKRILNMK